MSDEPVSIFAPQRRVLMIAAGLVALFGVTSSIYDGLRGDSPISIPPAEAAESTTSPEQAPLRLPAVGAGQGSVAGPVPGAAQDSVAGPMPAPPPPPAAAPRPAGFEQWIPLSLIDDFSGLWGG